MTTDLNDRAADLGERLEALLAEFDVPGAALAVAQGDQLVEVAGGVLNRDIALPVTTDSWFQIGSVTKIFTASLVMQLVDEDLAALDAPIRTYLPEFSVGDSADAEAAAAAITVRHLLTHTSGIQGDYFTDFGRGDDAVRRYVASLADIGMLHEPGELFSYCNSGFSVLGQMLEVLRDKPYEEILTERLLQPLGIAGGTTADQAIMHRSAVGHVAGPDKGSAVPAPVWGLPHASGPAGATLFMTPAGLVAFARMHLAGGVAPDGTRVLSESAVAQMQVQQASLPTGLDLRGIGASWALYQWNGQQGDGQTILGHNGGTIGQYSFLRVHPETETITVLLTNGPGGGRLHRALVEPLLTELTGLTPPPLPEPPADPPDLDVRALAGTYQHYGLDVEVALVVGGTAEAGTDGTALTVTMRPHQDGALADLAGGAETVRALPYRRDGAVSSLIAAEPKDGSHDVLFFLGEDAAGQPRFLHGGGRAFRRAGG